jgi:hypothetical protein
MPSSGKLRRVALMRTDVSKDRIASIIGGTRIGELGKTLAITSNRCIVFLRSDLRLLDTDNVPTSPNIVTLTMEVIVPPKRRFLQEQQGVTSQNTTFFIVSALKTKILRDNNRT